MVRSTFLRMKKGEIAGHIGRVVNGEILALASYDLRGLYENAILL
jgi:hypothetical protein